jgi:hypothetical protein
MLKFFRKFRQKLLSENKISKYLLYAIGEIVLVVIGILIALQINNWNEQKKIQNDSVEFMGRLLVEIKINIQQTENEIQQEADQVNSTKKVLDMFHQKQQDLNARTFDSLIALILPANNIEFNSATFTEGINTGKIGAIKSNELRTALYDFVAILEETRHQESLDSQDNLEVFSYYMYKKFNFKNMDNEFGAYKGQLGKTKFKSFNSLTVFDDMEFENIMDNRFYSNNLQLVLYKK